MTRTRLSAEGGSASGGKFLYLNLIVLTFAFMALIAPFVQVAPAQTLWYVATNGTGGGTSWADATNSIQGAINASSAGDTVWVSNGVYEVGGITNWPAGTLLTNRIAIYKTITVRSLNNDPTNTIIKGAWDPATNGPAAVRCVWMTNGSTLIGFTLTNGATLASGAYVERGGGVSAQSTETVISNCVIAGNSAGIYGGGVIYGTLYNCTLSGNSAVNGGGTYAGALYNCELTTNSASLYGGGASYGTLFNCTLSYNSVVSAVSYGGGTYNATLNNCMVVSNVTGTTGQGGGAYNSTLTNCTLIGNVAQWGAGAQGSTLYNCTLSGNNASYGSGGGGGANGGTLYNCILTNNSSSSANGGGGARSATLYNCVLVNNRNPYYGGGAIGSTLFNCLLTGNQTYAGALNTGGGAYNSTLYNCTVISNEAYFWSGPSGYGGGVAGGRLINCIVYFNTAPSAGSNWYEVVAFTNTCTTPVATNGVGNITSDPLFVDRDAGNYRLRVESPALNAGTNLSWMIVPTNVHSKDLDGQRRIDNFSRQVDMGCYELLPRGTMFIMK